MSNKRMKASHLFLIVAVGAIATVATAYLLSNSTNRTRQTPTRIQAHNSIARMTFTAPAFLPPNQALNLSR